MAKDVAQRDLDQSGFRISNLGDPKSAGDVTKTDNSTAPKANAGTGSPGTSYLAAAADHVHPESLVASGGGLVITLADPSQQAVKGSDAEVVSEFLVDFTAMETPSVAVSFDALVKVSDGIAKFRVQVGGTPGKADGKEIMGFSTNKADFDLSGATVDPLDTPKGLNLVKVVASTENPDSVGSIRSKTVQFRSLA